MRFSVVIPTLGRTDPLRETLDTVLVCDPPPTEVVIVDGDEQHAARPLVEAFAKRAGELSVRYVPSARGVPRQRQACIEAASGDVVVFVDDDALLDPGLFRV